MEAKDLDRIVLDAIAHGCRTFSAIAAYVSGQTGKDHATDEQAVMLIDRRLQSLRRKGKIVYTGQASGQGWRLKA